MTLRALFVTCQPYPPENVGGVERNTQALIRELRARGIAAGALATLSPTGTVSLAHRIVRKIAPKARFWPDRAAGHRTWRLWDPAADVEATVAALRPDVVVVQHFLPWRLAARFAEAGVPTVVYNHGVDFVRDPHPVPRHPLISVVTVSDFLATRMREAAGIEADVIRPIVPPARYRARTSRREVLFVNPRPEKGDDIAWALARDHPDIPFRFVEAWTNPPAVRRDGRARARALGNVAWCRSIADMRRYYRRAKVLLAPSRCEESWGRVVTEAQCSGIPVLASDRGALPEAVGAGGLLLPVDAGAAAWAAALGRLWHDAAAYRAMQEAALRHAARPEITTERIAGDLVAHLRARVAADRGVTARAARFA